MLRREAIRRLAGGIGAILTGDEVLDAYARLTHRRRYFPAADVRTLRIIHGIQAGPAGGVVSLGSALPAATRLEPFQTLMFDGLLTRDVPALERGSVTFLATEPAAGGWRPYGTMRYHLEHVAGGVEVSGGGAQEGP